MPVIHSSCSITVRCNSEPDHPTQSRNAWRSEDPATRRDDLSVMISTSKLQRLDCRPEAHTSVSPSLARGPHDYVSPPQPCPLQQRDGATDAGKAPLRWDQGRPGWRVELR